MSMMKIRYIIKLFNKHNNNYLEQHHKIQYCLIQIAIHIQLILNQLININLKYKYINNEYIIIFFIYINICQVLPIWFIILHINQKIIKLI